MSFVPLNLAIEFDGQVHTQTTGALVAADSTPTWAVYEQGNITPVYTGNMTARSTTGVYFMAGTASAANGFTVGKVYQVKMTAIVSGVTDITVLARFILVPAWTVAGAPKVDAQYFAGQTITAAAGVTMPAAPAAVGSAMTLTSGERDSVADALLNRDMATGTDTGSTTVRTVRQALRFLRNKWGISAGTLTVKKEDDATTSWTGAVTTTAGDPVSQIDPAG